VYVFCNHTRGNNINHNTHKSEINQNLWRRTRLLLYSARAALYFHIRMLIAGKTAILVAAGKLFPQEGIQSRFSRSFAILSPKLGW
jgi:hypothetical protein